MTDPKGKTIVIAASKGGVGKSTIATALAVRAAAECPKVALLDFEAQASASLWHRLRGSPQNPALAKVSNDIARDIDKLRALGFRWIIVDTPPDDMDTIDRAVEAADFVLIPTRVGLFDLAGIQAVIGSCQEYSKPFAFVLNGTNPEEPGWSRLIKSAADALKQLGPVLPKTIRERAAYISALNNGKSGPESADKRQAAAASTEVDAMWQSVKRLCGRKAGAPA